MADKTEANTESLPDLDDLLQCPVCYEIPSGQIFQCNEGHHVCGRCKMRLDMCPVCRAMFFGTRNYAMEELIANIKKLRAFKLGGKVTTECSSLNGAENQDENDDQEEEEEEDNNHNFASRPTIRAPQACKGLFRCLCCKTTNGERLPAARLLNHLRYYHKPELIEGKSENGEYLQAWQFSTDPGRIVTAVRVADMGVFFLIIEMADDQLCAWLTMAAAPWVAQEFCYTLTISGNDREAIFSDCVWSVRSCEGSLKKRGHCLVVSDTDARMLTSPALISGKLSVRRVPVDQVTAQVQPRAVLRVASRGAGDSRSTTSRALPAPAPPRAAPTRPAHHLEPFLQELQNDVARLSRAFATIGREANALVRSENEMRARIENASRNNQTPAERERPNIPSSPPVPPPVQNQPNTAQPLSRNARRRMRNRMRAALNEAQPVSNSAPAVAVPQRNHLGNGPVPPAPSIPIVHRVGLAIVQQMPPTPAPTAPTSAPAPAPAGPSNGELQNGNQSRAAKKKRRQRR